MLKIRSVILAGIALSILLLPLAHLKVILFGVPLYSVEAPLLVALFAYLYGWKSGEIPSFRKMNFHDPRTIGIALFFLGAIISFIANPFSLMGLGMLKTWFVFPLLLAGFIFQLQLNEREKSILINVWFLSTLLAACGALLYAVMGEMTYDGRLAAWLLSPNYLAILIAPGIPITFYRLRESLEGKAIRKNILFIASLLVFLVVLFLAHSYGVWLGVFGALFCMVFLPVRTSVQKNIWKWLGVVVIIAAIFLSFEHTNQKWQALVSFDGRSSLTSRTMIWRSATRMILDRPIFGIGLGRFQETYLEYQKYYPPYLEWAVPEPHNIALAVWLETGLLGFIGFILIIISSVNRALKNKNRESAVLLGLLVLYLLYGIFDTPYFKTDLAFAFWFLIALI